MKYISTVFNLYSEVSRYRLSGQRERWSVFFTLLNLYIKSKLSLGKTGEISHPLAGFIVHAYDYPTLIQLYRDIFLSRIYNFATESSAPFIIDCGAHIGMSVLYFRKQYPDCVLWAFEPNPHSFSLLVRNIEVNGIRNVEVFNCALSDTVGVAEFYLPIKRGGLNGSFLEGYTPSGKAEVSTRKLSTLIQGMNVDFIKMDIEGGEESVVKDLFETDQLKRVRQLVIEYHHRINGRSDSLSQFLRYFENSGFQYSYSGVDEFSSAPQNLIMRFRKI